MRGVLALLLAWAISAGAAAAAPVLLNTSHSGAISDLAYDPGRGILVSGGEDGSVRVWSIGERRLLAAVQVSHRPIQSLALNPRQPQFAALVGDGLKTDTLSCWDWERSRELFSIEGDEQLLHVAYSPLGSYLFYSKAAYDSLVALDPDSGRILPYMGRGFGIVSYFTIARNEANIMTYQPSGALAYWDIRGGRSVRELRTLPDLAGMEISGNNRFAAAVTAEELVVVDLLSGDVAARTRAAGLGGLAFSPEGNQVTAVAGDGQGGRALLQWYFGGRTLLELGRPAGFPASGFEPRSLSYTEAGLAVALDNGTISLTAGGQTRVLAEDLRLPIHDLAFSGSRLVVATEAQILMFDSQVFSTDPDIDLGPGESLRRQWSFPSPISGPVGVAFLDEGRLLVSSRGEGAGQLHVLDTFSGALTRVGVQFASPLKQLSVAPEGLIAVESSGLCRILDRRSLEPRFQYNAPGMNKLVFAFSDVLLGGKTSISSFAAPLLQINRRTGETVPIADPSLFIYDLLYGEQASAVYSLAVERHGDRLYTVLKIHTGYNFERARTLYEFRGEDLGASVVSDASGRVYSSLGFDTVRVWSGGRGLTFQASRGVPRRLYVHGAKLYSLNRDSSISVWDLEKRSWLLDIALLKDASWVALTPDGGAVTSEGAQQHLSRGPSGTFGFP